MSCRRRQDAVLVEVRWMTAVSTKHQGYFLSACILVVVIYGSADCNKRISVTLLAENRVSVMTLFLVSGCSSRGT